ncbi:MAG: cytochrome c oxidase subunit II [Chloroflexi bacterium]|nr:cytochrome c oxidase subunit II [Chloroflexota bacterium]
MTNKASPVSYIPSSIFYPLFSILCLLSSILIITLLPTVALAAPPSPLDPASAEAEKTATLYWLAFWIAVAVFLSVEGLLLYAVIRFRQRDPAVIPSKIHGSTPLEIAWTAAPAIVLLILFVLMVRTMRDTAKPATAAMPIKVIAHQWWWEFQYPKSGVVIANELHVPVGQPVMVELNSDNVIHSFWIPRLAGKTDVVPGQTNTMWFQAGRVGVYRGQCAELCGTQHANMNFVVVAQPAEDFRQWAEWQQSPAVEATSETAAGEQVFMTTGACLGCHTVNGTEAKGTNGPDLTHIGSRQTIAGGALENTPENLAHWLTNPQAVKPGNKMTIGQLSQDDIAALVQYLTSLK